MIIISPKVTDVLAAIKHYSTHDQVTVMAWVIQHDMRIILDPAVQEWVRSVAPLIHDELRQRIHYP